MLINQMNKRLALGIPAGVLGAGVLASYIPIAKEQTQKTNDYWLGLDNSARYVFYACWVLAAAGFLWYLGSTIFAKNQPADAAGLFSYGDWIRPVLVASLLVTSAAWSFFVYQWFHTQKTVYKVLTSTSLVITAGCTILLLAGEAEAGAEWHRILGLLCFALVAVLVDGVMWNARFVLSSSQ